MYFFDSAWQTSFVITVLIELFVATAWQRLSRNDQPGVTTWVLTLVVGINLVTHPLAWLASSHDVNFFLIELAVVVAEAGILWMIPSFKWLKAFFMSITMNLASIVLGLAVLAVASPSS